MVMLSKYVDKIPLVLVNSYSCIGAICCASGRTWERARTTTSRRTSCAFFIV